VTQKIDRKVINVGKDLTATGTSASELLNNVQSVSVDPQTGGITLRGNENVKVLVDGRPTNVSAAQLLQQIPSSSIKSIELITNPSAKYNPEGMSGIINIVLYKNATLGLNGTISGGLTYGRNLSYNGALDVNYRKGKVNFFANYGGSGGASGGGGEVVRLDNGLQQDIVNGSTSASHLLKLGADVYLNKKNTLSVYTTQNIFRGTDSRDVAIYFEDLMDSDNLQSADRENYTGTYNLNFRHDFNEKGHSLEFEGSHSMTDKWSEGLYTNMMDPSDPVSNYMDGATDDVQSSIFNLDYTNPLTEKIKLELGLEARLSGTDNAYATSQHRPVYDESGNQVPDGSGGFLTEPLGNTEFTYDRSIYSAYANYAHQFGKLSMQLGVRVEHYAVNGLFSDQEDSQAYQDSRFTAYPSAFLTYQAGEKNQFQVSYSRRVDRPGIGQVNPMRSPWSSPLIVFAGNPELTPQFTNSYELSYSRRMKKGSLSMGVFYRYINDNIIRYTEVDELDENKVLVTWENAEGEDRYGFEASGMYRPAKWVNMNASFDIYYRLLTGYAFGEQVEVESYSTNVRLNNTFTITDKFSLQLFGMFRGPRASVQWTFKPMWMVNTGASYKVFNKRGTISLRLNDVFNSMRFGFESNENWYESQGRFFWESRKVYLGYSHRFGQGKNKARRMKSRDNHELSGGEGF
jgi:outer membrane cobalamin receptor